MLHPLRHPSLSLSLSLLTLFLNSGFSIPSFSLSLSVSRGGLLLLLSESESELKIQISDIHKREVVLISFVLKFRMCRATMELRECCFLLPLRSHPRQCRCGSHEILSRFRGGGEIRVWWLSLLHQVLRSGLRQQLAR